LRAKRIGRRAKRFGLRAKRIGRRAERSGLRAKRIGRRAERFGLRATRPALQSAWSGTPPAQIRLLDLRRSEAAGNEGCRWQE